MGVLQIYLKSGRQFVDIPNHINQSNFKLVKVDSHFNVENHGFYQARIYMNFLPANLITNNLKFNRSVVVPLDHNKSFTSDYTDMDIGTFKVPRSFEVNVDLDSGHQVVDESQTKADKDYSFKKFEGSTATTDYVIDPPASDRRVSLGLNADKILSEEIETTLPAISAGGAQVKGPLPFLYSMVITFTYDDAILL